MSKNRKIALLSMCACLAMLLSFVESRIPHLTAIPGIKMGLANIAVIFALYKFGVKEAAVVSILRALIVAMLFGSPVSLMYSAAGAVLSLLVMVLLKKLTPLGEVAVSVCGGVMHNVGQIGMASILLDTNVVVYYLPFLLLSGTVAGIVVGIASALLVKRINIKK